MSLLRTPAERFEDLPGFPYEPGYADIDGVRMAFVDEGSGDETFLCLHGEPTWGYLYRKMLPTLADAGRVVVPDFPGFGRSDKYPNVDDYGFGRSYDALVGFIEALDLTGITLVCQDWGGLLGLTAAANHPGRFARLVPMNTALPDGTGEMPEEWWAFHDFVVETDDLPVGLLIERGCVSDLSDGVVAAYEAPFPDAAYKAGARAWPQLVPTDPDMAGADEMADARERLAEWDDPAFVLFSDSDPITRGARDELRDLLPTAGDQPDVWIEGAGHFLQEDAGGEVAERIVAFVERTPV